MMLFYLIIYYVMRQELERFRGSGTAAAEARNNSYTTTSNSYSWTNNEYTLV